MRELFSVIEKMCAHTGLIIPVVVLVVCVGLSIIKHKLTVTGGITGGIVAILVYAGLGYTGVGMLGTFFLLGTAATSWQRNKKEKAGVAEKNRGRRTANQVLANGGVAALAGGLCLLFAEQNHMWQPAIAGSLAAATADTLSSELGMVYGSNCYNIITLKKDRCGTNGVVSIEGTLIGIAGSIIIAILYAGIHPDISPLAIVIAGTMGNIVDSLLGATLERKGIIGNNVVNLLNTAAGALIACLFLL